MNPKNNTQVLTDSEFEETVNRVRSLIPVTAGIMGKAYEQKITKHLTSIASYDVLVATDPTTIYNLSKSISEEAALIKFYKQIQYHLFSSKTNGYPDFYVRLCNNMVAGLVNNEISDYNFNTNGGILDLANSLYKKSFLEYFIRPTKEKVLRSFLLDHPHLVVQLLIMQFYQHPAA